MHRLFVATRPPVEIRTALLTLMGGITGARWQDDNQLHLTLRFVGEVDRHSANDLADALSRIAFSPFDIALSGIGCFDRKGHIDTLWAGVQPRSALENLHRKIDRTCVSVGLLSEERAYLPHITLARFSRSASPVTGFLTRHAGLSSALFTIDRFALFESRLGSTGATYHEIESYPAREASTGNKVVWPKQNY